MNERVRIATSHRNPGEVAISWDAREQLLARLGPSPATLGLIETFRTVGTSAPVYLTLEEKQVLYRALEAWRAELGDERGLPEGIWDVRCALEQDPNGAGG